MDNTYDEKTDAPAYPGSSTSGFTPPEDEGKVADIGKRLNAIPAQEERKTDEPRGEDTFPFDMGKLTPEQLQLLKARLAVTPERLSIKKPNARTFLRTIGGNFVVATKPSYLALVYDATRLSEVETHKIPVKFHNSDKWVDVIYTDFMKADRVACEIVSIREERGTKTEGEVVQRETGKIVSLEVAVVEYFFTVKLPDGTTTEVAGSASNA